MGRIGFDSGSWEPGSSASPGSYGELMNALGELVDDISVASVRVAAAQADELRSIERARAWAVDTAFRPPAGGSRRSRDELAERSFAAELASALHVSEGAARNRIWLARCLVNDLPHTLELLADGAVSMRHAQILVDQVVNLDPESLAMLEQEVLPRGMQQTPQQFERSVRAMSERLNLESMVERQVAAAEERTIYLEPMPHGMGRLCIEAPIVQLVAANNRLTDIAKSLQIDGELRTLTQLKVDVVTDILNDVEAEVRDGHRATTAGQGDGPVARFRNIRPRILVTVPALTLVRRGIETGQPSEPGTLEGYGPIDPQTAREIAGNAKSMIRILSHPETGIILSMGRKRYRIPSDLRTYLRMRDGTCRFPGCSRNAKHAELDHTREWASENGETAFNNLAFLCPGHHALKGNTAWKVQQNPDGSGNLTWTTPTGRILHTEPEVRVAPPNAC